MGKSKRAPALFEVIRRQGASSTAPRIGVPRWWKGLPRDHAETASHKAAPAATEATPHDAAHDRQEPVAVRATPAPQMAEGHEGVESMAESRDLMPRLRIEDGRIDVSLNYVSAGLVVGAVLIALLCSYQIGRASGRSGTQTAGVVAASGLDGEIDAVAAVRESVPNPAVLDPGPRESRPPVPPPSRTAQAPANVEPKATEKSRAVEPPKPALAARIPGLNHIVVERFHTDLPGVTSVEDARAQAEHAQKWLAERCGLRTVLEPIKNGYRLVTEQMFKYPEEKDVCRQVQEAILGYGKQYTREGNRYVFNCYVEKIK